MAVTYKKRKSGVGNKAIICLIIPVLIFLCAFAYFEIKVRHILSEAARSRAAAYGTEIINTAVTNALTNCSTPVKVTSSSDGIAGVEVNVAALSEIRTKATESLKQATENADMMSFSVPIGTLADSTLLSGLGTPVTIRLVPIGDISTDVRTEFTAVGINQTLHKMILRCEINMNMLVAGENVSLSVKNDVTVAETVIVGKVPDAYTAINRFEIDEQEENDLNDYAATLP